jgi:hypothetical protein
MILSDMRPDAEIARASDLGFRDIDKNYEWFTDFRIRCPDIDLTAVPDFIRQARESTNLFDANVSNHLLDPDSLNPNQRLVFDRIESHYNTLLSDLKSTDPLRLIVLGTAGTGKSYLINMIRDRLTEIARDHNIDESPLMLLAPTGVAAFNIRGLTIHSSLSVPVSNRSLDLAGENLKKIQTKLAGVHYFIIDEKSMVGRCMLGLIDMCLWQAFPNSGNQVFGSRSVILVGDFDQLPPVRDEPMYSRNPRQDSLSNDAIAVYQQFREVY